VGDIAVVHIAVLYIAAFITVYAQISAAALISFGGLWVRRLFLSAAFGCGVYFFRRHLGAALISFGGIWVRRLFLSAAFGCGAYRMRRLFECGAYLSVYGISR
jgi:hypothetical protein